MENEVDSLKKIQQQIEHLHQYTQHLNKYLSEINVYEYYIQKVTVESVKGTLQIGHLMEEEIKEEDGVHRFYIGDLKIIKIEDSGTVGLGVTEKGTSSKEEDEIVSPEDASPEIKKIYEEIKILLGVEEVPEFFQQIASKEIVLNKVWDFMTYKWSASYGFNTFYERILSLLNEIEQFEDDITNPLLLDDQQLILLANSIEEKAKSLLLITDLLKALLPRYLDTYNTAQNMIHPENLLIKKYANKQVSRKQIKTAIKSTFNLTKFPDLYDELLNDPDLLSYVYYHRIQPIVLSEVAISYFNSMNDLYPNVQSSQITGFSPDEQILLFSSLINYLATYQKEILLEYILL
ncbi:hypothetical protein [Bacillus sp. AK128]